jgi:hypothetical protein
MLTCRRHLSALVRENHADLGRKTDFRMGEVGA